MWSRILESDVGRFVVDKLQQNEKNGCSYHNLNHVLSMYKFLENTSVPYDYELDLAVLFHDSIYDSSPEKELRSANFFLEAAYLFGLSCDFSRVVDMIMSTKYHNYSEESANIIKADLHGLANVYDTLINFGLIKQESKALYTYADVHLTNVDFAEASLKFMTGLQSRIEENVSKCSSNEDREFFVKVLEGISLTKGLSRSILEMNRIFNEQGFCRDIP